MSMKHTYATGASAGTRTQWSGIGGTDTLNPAVNDTTGTVEVVASTSAYGANAVRLTTSATAGETCQLYVPLASATEYRAHIILDMPTLTSGDVLYVAKMQCDSGQMTVQLQQTGVWGVDVNGGSVYRSAAAALPAAGTRLLVSVAGLLAWASSTWRAAVYNDETGALIGTEQSGTAASWTGTGFYDLYVGKVAGVTCASKQVMLRAIRAETGPGCSLALLPAETALAPAVGVSVVPIRHAATTGSAPSPTGAAMVTALADGSDASTVTIPGASAVRVALRPVTPPTGSLAFKLAKAVASAAGNATVTLWNGNSGSQIGPAKTVPLTTTATDTTVTFTAGDLAGVAAADWEALQLQVAAP